jgi:hypothetical protein
MLFEKAVSSWWVGLCEDSKNMFVNLYKNYQWINDGYRNSVINNLKFMKVNTDTL